MRFQLELKRPGDPGVLIYIEPMFYLIDYGKKDKVPWLIDMWSVKNHDLFRMISGMLDHISKVE